MSNCKNQGSGEIANGKTTTKMDNVLKLILSKIEITKKNIML